MKVNIPDIVVKEDLIIECDVTFGWMYIIEVFNDTYLQFVQPGGFHFPIKYNGWEAGEYEAKVTMMDNKYCYATYTTHFKVLKENTTNHVVKAIGDKNYNPLEYTFEVNAEPMTGHLSSSSAQSSGISTDSNALEGNLTPDAKNNNLSHYNIGKTLTNNPKLTGVALVLFVLITFCLFVVARKREN